MKKKNLISVALLFAALGLVSCKTTSTFETHLESFVTAYYDYANYKLKINSVGDVIVIPDIENIYYENSQNQDDLNRFAELSSKYGDANFHHLNDKKHPTPGNESQCEVHDFKQADFHIR